MKPYTKLLEEIKELNRKFISVPDYHGMLSRINNENHDLRARVKALEEKVNELMNIDDTGFDPSGIEKALKGEAPGLMEQTREIKYFVLAHNHPLGLQVSVTEALYNGFKLAGGVSTHFEQEDGRLIYIQAVYKDV